jgi:hypothetical protein
MNQKQLQSRTNAHSLVRRQNTISRIKRVKDRYKELCAVRHEGIKLSTQSIVDKLAREFVLSTLTIYDFIATDVEAKEKALMEITGQFALFEA